MHELSRDGNEREIPAFDVGAACSGYLYALSIAQGLLRTNPEWRVMILTTEAMSTVVDANDFATEILFGDAATATFVWNRESHGAGWASLAHPPVLGARGDGGDLLRVGFPPEGRVEMAGGRVFSEAVRRMGQSLRTACERANVRVHDLDAIVPHQANGRLIDSFVERHAIARERVVNVIAEVGNTSSSSIPLALSGATGSRGRIGLCAFGGGLTFGAALLEIESAD